MNIKINGIELELEDGASVEVSPDGKITIKAGPVKPEPYPAYWPYPVAPNPTWPIWPNAPTITWSTPSITVCDSGSGGFQIN